MNRYLKFIGGSLLYLTTGMIAFCGESSNLINPDAVLTVESVRKANDDLNVVVDKLVANLKKTFDGHVNYIEANGLDIESVSFLGLVRSEAALDLCIKNLAVMSTARGPNRGSPDYTYYPFALALLRIGAPALDQLKEIIKSDDVRSTRFELSCLIIRGILSDSLAQQWLNSILKPEIDANRCVNVERIFKVKPEYWRSPGSPYRGESKKQNANAQTPDAPVPPARLKNEPGDEERPDPSLKPDGK